MIIRYGNAIFSTIPDRFISSASRYPSTVPIRKPIAARDRVSAQLLPISCIMVICPVIILSLKKEPMICHR